MIVQTTSSARRWHRPSWLPSPIGCLFGACVPAGVWAVWVWLAEPIDKSWDRPWLIVAVIVAIFFSYVFTKVLD